MITGLYILFLICWAVSAFLAIKKSSKTWLYTMWGFWLASTITNWFI